MGKQDLSQMGAANVSIEDFEGEPCIYKGKASDVELDFYQFAAAALDGVNTPKLLSISGNNLVIEALLRNSDEKPNLLKLSDFYTIY